MKTERVGSRHLLLLLAAAVLCVSGSYAATPGYPERMLIEQSDIDVASIRLRRPGA